MNYRKKLEYNKHIKGLFRSNSPEGNVKYSNTGILHFRVLCEVLHWFKKQGYDCWTEVVFKSGGRADLVAVKDQFAYVVEILVSETDKRYKEKLNTYPIEFDMLAVKAKDFEYNSFSI